MFVLSFKNSDKDASRNLFDKYYVPLVETKDFSALICSKPFFSICKKQTRSIWKTMEISKNNDYTTGNFRFFILKAL